MNCQIQHCMHLGNLRPRKKKIVRSISPGWLGSLQAVWDPFGDANVRHIGTVRHDFIAPLGHSESYLRPAQDVKNTCLGAKEREREKKDDRKQ